MATVLQQIHNQHINVSNQKSICHTIKKYKFIQTYLKEENEKALLYSLKCIPSVYTQFQDNIFKNRKHFCPVYSQNFFKIIKILITIFLN